jgi:hypothetical protein
MVRGDVAGLLALDISRAMDVDPADVRGADLELAFATGRLVIKCWVPECPLHRLPNWPEGVWMATAPRDYGLYSHGICQRHLRQYQREIERLLAPPANLAAADVSQAAAG